jgi:hypothetical protein
MSTRQQADRVASARTEPRHLVVALFQAYAATLGDNRWPWEEDRWHELTYCILATAGEPDVRPGDTRRVAAALARLGLLEPDRLASMTPPTTTTPGDRVWAAIDTALTHAGFSLAKSRTALTTLLQVAVSLQSRFGGRIQNYLRQQGEAMVAQLRKDFGISDFGEARRALAIWLQNTTNMPVAASDFLTDQACRHLGTSYERLAEAAVLEGLNVALLDDVLRRYWDTTVSGRRHEAEPGLTTTSLTARRRGTHGRRRRT